MENIKNTYNKKLIGTTWLTGKSSCTLVIPKTLAEEYGLDKPSNVIVRSRPDGILITKLKLENNDCPRCRIRRDTLTNQANMEGVQSYKNG